MNTIEQAHEILEQMRQDGIPDEDLQVDDVLIEENGQLLIRSTTLTYLAGEYYLGVNYGVWHDREMYNRRIYGEYLEDGEEVVYFTALAGSEDEEMIELFHQMQNG
jgi:uncharacterized NAD(P)/FAD-binding protein YdhS